MQVFQTERERPMKTATPCPSCRQPITLGRVLRAPTPFHLSCSGCGARLRVRGTVTPAALVIAILLGLVLADVLRTHGMRALVPTIVIVLVAELVAGLVVLNVGQLEPRA